MPHYDFIAIGGGNAGLAAAHRIARAGRKVALVDRGPVGGLCSLAGCNPKKVLVRATEVLEEVRRAGEHGIETGEVRIAWPRVIARKRGFTDPVPEKTEEALAKSGVILLRGSARFASVNALEVAGEKLTAEGFLVATGSTPRRLGFPGAELAKTSDDILELSEVPGDLVILGAGVVAFEFGQVFARVGSRVTMLHRSARALSNMDEQMAEAVLSHSRRLGLEFLAHAQVREIRRVAGRLAVEANVDGEERVFPADFVLNAVGRVPAIESLALAAAGVEASPEGVLVDEYLRSPGNRRVFAAGDARGRPQLSPVASYEGRLVAKNFLEGDTVPARYDGVPQALYTVPPLAAVGMTEAQAREKGLDIEIALNDMSDWKVYAIAGERPALSKVVTEKGSRKILGAHLFGASAAEQIHVFAMAIRFGLTAEDLGHVVWAYPTFSSALGSALP